MRRKVQRKQTLTGKALFEFLMSKGRSIEYFDDRFYMIPFPKEVDQAYLKHCPAAWRDDEPEKTINVYFPSVTTIQGIEDKPFLATWRGDVGNRVADYKIDFAQNRGSNIHNAIEWGSRGYDIIYQNLKTQNISDKEIRAYARKRRKKVVVIHSQEEMVQVGRYFNLLKVIQPKIVEAEQKVFSFDKWYAGTLDQVWDVKAGEYPVARQSLKLPTGRILLDWKTGNSFDESGTLEQLAAYYNAYYQKDKVVGVMAVHLNSKRKLGIEGVKVVFKTVKQLKPYFDAFTKQNELFRLRNKDIMPKYLEVPTIIVMKTYMKRRQQ